MSRYDLTIKTGPEVLFQACLTLIVNLQDIQMCTLFVS